MIHDGADVHVINFGNKQRCSIDAEVQTVHVDTDASLVFSMVKRHPRHRLPQGSDIILPDLGVRLCKNSRAKLSPNAFQLWRPHHV